ncbi:thiamine pyrophosphate-requiring protein [Trebonia sp.]|uniref:thiamine pyrophosphate-requiring protein n=1 Tax=Trebonia sp. TaxID=2767075 RepID=UPI0026328BF3|nr:thiamine pyrophosphate-requiring protein [Trebonia sp.]
MTERYYTTSTAFLEALAEAGVKYIFANLGSDHPGLIEALAQAKAEGRDQELPQLIVCPHETVALSAAHAYAAVSRMPQAVIVHVDAGTQNLGGAIGNVMRGRVPVLVFAGAAPYTMQNELPGGRNEFIHWIQDVHDQRGIMRAYTKYDNEIRSGRNVKQLVHRALQIAASEPAGPVYLVGPREVMEEQLEPHAADPAAYRPVEPAALTAEVAGEIAAALAGARHPLIITGHLGRDPEAVPKLVDLAGLLAIPVIESAAFRLNFPADHPMHRGWQFTTREQTPLLAEADVILVVDSDIPYIFSNNRPSPDASIYVVDIDPLKYGMSLWHVPARRSAAANAKVALEQIAVSVREHGFDRDLVAARRADVTAAHDAQRAAWDALERHDGTVITPQYLTACVRDLLAGEDPLFLTEAVTNFQVVAEHLRLSKPGSLIGSGGGSLGWSGGGAVGAKLAAPERTVVSLVGDGTFLFSVPSSAHWVARRYGTPTLTVIYDNRGWKAPKQSTLGVHPSGAASASDDFHVSFEPEADLPGVAAAAGGAFAATVTDPAELPSVLKEALDAVHGGRSAVVAVHIPLAQGAGGPAVAAIGNTG